MLHVVRVLRTVEFTLHLSYQGGNAFQRQFDWNGNTISQCGVSNDTHWTVRN